MITPSGNRRKMERQDYIHGASASGELIETMLRKLAALDINRDPSEMAGTLAAPPAANKPAEPGPPEQAVPESPAGPGVQDAMNQSNTLPGKQPPQTGGLEDKVTQIVQAVLQGLKIDSSQWMVTNSSTSDGETLTSIKIDMKRKPGPQVAKP